MPPSAAQVTPEQFDWYREQGEAMGFRYVASGPMVRSSYKAGEVFMEAFLEQRDAEREAVEAGPASDDGAALPRSAVWSPEMAQATG